MQIEDYEQVYALWLTISGFAIRSVDDSKEGVERFLQFIKESTEDNLVW